VTDESVKRFSDVSSVTVRSGCSSTTQPSRQLDDRACKTYDRVTSECVTWTIVVPDSFKVRNSSMISLPAPSGGAGWLVGENHLRVRDDGRATPISLLLAAGQLDLG